MSCQVLFANDAATTLARVRKYTLDLNYACKAMDKVLNIEPINGKKTGTPENNSDSGMSSLCYFSCGQQTNYQARNGHPGRVVG